MLWSFLLQNRAILAFLLVSLILATLAHLSYVTGYKKGITELTDKLNQERLNNSQIIINKEREYKVKEQEIIKDYLQQMEILKDEYEKNLIVSNNLRDTFIPDCVQQPDTSNTRVSRETTNKSTARCYSESDLLGKVKETMAIGRECDQLAIKYNSLLEWCKQ